MVSSIDRGFNFTLVYGLVDAYSDKFMEQEEVVSVVGVEVAAHLEVHLLVVFAGLFVSGDLDYSTLACWSF